MPNPLYVMDFANLFCGAAPTDETASNHLVITELKLPTMDMQTVDHRPGGAPIAIEIDTVMARLECTFVLAGITPQVMELIDSWVPEQRLFFAYGNVRDPMTGIAVQAAAVMQGQLGRVDPQNWRKSDVLHYNYTIKGIIHYEFNLAGEPIYYWDFFTNTRIVGTYDQNAIINQNLSLPITAPARLLPITAPIG